VCIGPARPRERGLKPERGAGSAGAAALSAVALIGHAAGTRARESIMILAAMTSVVALTWGFGLERAKGIEPS
jgi:hypothetical protein